VLDGNIGIGGFLPLLRRSSGLLAGGGTVLVALVPSLFPHFQTSLPDPISQTPGAAWAPTR